MMQAALQVPEIPAEPFGKYFPIVKIGDGGMGEVLLVTTLGPAGLCKLQVLKVLRAELTADPEMHLLFLDEARLTARLNHPNVVQTTEIGEHDGHVFIAMEYIEGQPLSVLATGQGRTKLTRPIALRIVCDVLSGLSYVHMLQDFDGTPLGIVHRDLSPRNILVSYEGAAKLVDFGIAFACKRSVVTTNGAMRGTLAYMSPEHACGELVDARSDIFSAGIILYELLTQRRAWDRMGDLDIFRALANSDIPFWPAGDDSGMPEELRRICARALAIKPSDRYQTAKEMLDDVERYLQATGERATHHDVSDLVATLFSAQRCEVRRLVEARVRELRTDEGDGYYLADALASASASMTPNGAAIDETSPDKLFAATAERDAETGPRWRRARTVAVAAALTLIAIALARPTRAPVAPTPAARATTTFQPTPRAPQSVDPAPAPSAASERPAEIAPSAVPPSASATPVVPRTKSALGKESSRPPRTQPTPSPSSIPATKPHDLKLDTADPWAH